MKKYVDKYEEAFNKADLFKQSIAEMEENSHWSFDIPTAEIRLDTIIPIEVHTDAASFGIDPDVVYDTASENGSNVILHALGKTYCVRSNAMASIHNAAGLDGSTYKKMPLSVATRSLNDGLTYAGKRIVMLERYDKISALHGGGNGGYEIIPIDKLVSSTERILADKFGEVEFVSGSNGHDYTSAIWILPDVQNDFLTAYQDMLDTEGLAPCKGFKTFMPAVRFSSSDTSESAARLIPVYYVGKGRYLKLVDGISVKHTKSGLEKGQTGLTVYENEISNIYAKFNDINEAIGELAKIKIDHAENTVIKLCNEDSSWKRIAKKYGDVARAEVAKYANPDGSIEGHNFYFAMTAALSAAEAANASKITIANIDEALAKIAAMRNFSDYDIGGVVSWN